ncbi:auxilin-related protein 2-like [Punica granatum]|uniref:Auxilin-related protein 2-like n=2 Tax=Punica granatum TaxID=22663 RepID=A0A6P8E6C7_PUNGR|nr:auxilin-related protein 2-like [Punica granatum]PKI31685.1 hypothetical protein CRG98_047895 [Punica granatum]
MNDFEGLLPPDYGFKPQGKSAPMAGSRATSSSNPRSSSRASVGSYGIDPDSLFGARGNQKSQAFDEFGDIFRKPEARKGGNSSAHADSSPPVFDKPVYDDDIFDGVPGLKTSNSVNYENVFAPKKESGSGRFDDLVAGLGKKEDYSKGKGSKNADFDDLLPGFSGSSSSTQRQTKESDWSSRPTMNSNKKMDDPFAGVGSTSPHVASSSGLYTDPLEEISKLSNSGSARSNEQSAMNKGSNDDLDPFDSIRKSMPSLSTEKINGAKDESPLRTDGSSGDSNRFSVRSAGTHSRGTTHVDRARESQSTFFNMPTFSNSTRQSTSHSASYPSQENGISTEANIQADDVGSSDEVWLTVSEIPLFTQPTKAPPPSRPPPPRPVRPSKTGSSSFGSRNGKFPSSSQQFTGSKPVPPANRSSVASSIDELEDFAKGRSRNNNSDDLTNGLSTEELDMHSDAAASAAAMKEAMERAEAKFRHAKEMRERENSRAARSRESVQLEKDESVEDIFRDKQERLEREQLQREKDEEERERRRLEKEREREEQEREQRRIERERARQAVERATREARERAAAEALLKAERAAVGKAQTDARERAERAAVQRAQAEARERAANEAKERAERAAAEARDREMREKAAEARVRAERAAVERAAAEARERAAKEAREKAAAAARASQQKNANDLDSIFNMGSQAPRPRASASDPAFNGQFQTRQGHAAAKTSATATSNIKKAASTANIVDDLTSIFGGAAPSGEFQEVEGETEERRRARLERHQRTQERAAKALAEKNQRDLQTQREQEERHRIAETLDIEIKRWAAGKEGNLRALLSTLQYVLWPECGWQPVSLTDLITGAAVKKVYRKATLCIHPDKVQQKGANLQQKYIAEKVFDLLKEAWNKFNSEELF